jgi:hypothetical protein
MPRKTTNAFADHNTLSDFAADFITDDSSDIFSDGVSHNIANPSSH